MTKEEILKANNINLINNEQIYTGCLQISETTLVRVKEC